MRLLDADSLKGIGVFLSMCCVGDSQQPDVEIELRPRAAETATEFLKDRPELQRRLQRISHLVSGFETPYGMELLSSGHWVATHVDEPARDVESAVRRVAAWNERKQRMFKPAHIRVAWQRLADQKWV